MVLIDGARGCCDNKQRKRELIALLTQIVKVSSGVILVVATDSLTIPNAVGHNFRQKFFSALHMNWRMVSRLLAFVLDFVYVDEPGRYRVPSLGKLENVSKWGL